VEIVRRMITAGVNCPRASSAGRLFDAVAALLGLCDDADYEGEAAIALETAAAAHPGGPGAVTALPWRVHEQDGLLVYDPTPTLRGLLVSDGDPAELAARFHRTVAEVTAHLVGESVARTRVRQVCLGGGVFQNVLLSTMIIELLRDAGLEVFIGREVPVNDGGISYGQAAVAAARRAGGG
jgi:hydrogenase maturation protein HypF